MLTIVEKIYPTQFYKLESIVEAFQRHSLNLVTDLAAQNEMTHQLDNAFEQLADIDNSAEVLQARLFLNALSKRLESCTSNSALSGPASLPEVSNLYLVEDEGQQIKMFDLMAQKFPLVKHAQDIANATFIEHAQDAAEVVFLDIGMGTGQQVANLLRQFQSSASPLKRMIVLGIEPSSDSLQIAETRLKALAGELGIAVDFLGLAKTMEQLDEADWQMLNAQIQRHAAAPLLLNASFAMHHIKPVALRTELFHRLKALSPTVFMMIEPYADFITHDLMARFQNAWHHYGLVFQAIDGIDASIDEKNMVKEIFFGREIQDVLAKHGRTEQFETAEMWTERHTDAGFTPVSVSFIPAQSHVKALFTPELRQHYIGLNVQTYPVVAIMGVH